jgi:hypothetical protein
MKINPSFRGSRSENPEPTTKLHRVTQSWVPGSRLRRAPE